MWWRLQPHVIEAAATCDRRCSHMWWRLQPHVIDAAATCDRRCSHMWSRLQQNVVEAATICDPGELASDGIPPGIAERNPADFDGSAGLTSARIYQNENPLKGLISNNDRHLGALQLSCNPM